MCFSLSMIKCLYPAHCVLRSKTRVYILRLYVLVRCDLLTAIRKLGWCPLPVRCMALTKTGDHNVGGVVTTISKHQVHVNKKDNKTKRSVDEMTVEKTG